MSKVDFVDVDDDVSLVWFGFWLDVEPEMRLLQYFYNINPLFFI